MKVRVVPGAVSSAVALDPRMNPPGSKYAVKHAAGGTQAVEGFVFGSHLAGMSRAFHEMAQLIILPISDIMST
jgi:hypothetical protein